MRILVADDEELARRELNDILSLEQDVEIVGQAANGLEAVERAEQLRPDLIFLDIEMPGLNGFEVINSLRQLPRIVFVTAYDQYAIRAFEVNAIDYLLKPVSSARVRRTLERARQVEAAEADIDSHAIALQRLTEAIQQGQPNRLTRLAVNKGRRIVLVRLCDIVYIKVEDKLVYVYTLSDRFMINKTISELEKSLSHDSFFRINRSTIVNLEYLAEIIPWFSATCMLKMSNGLELPLSRERVAHLKEAVGLLKQDPSL